ncbi:MAG: disulfide bond formation protein B [Pseudobdellovibrionaceae bacterium]
MNSDLALKISFLIAVAGTVGGLFFSEVMKLPPCDLCWYQRIALYPLIIIFGVGIAKTGRDSFRYAIGLILVGLALAIFHNLLYYGIIPESISPCKQGASCTTKQIEWLGFITIPLMSLTSFIILSGLAWFGLCKKGCQLEK